MSRNLPDSELLSALFDGECDAAELTRALNRVSADPGSGGRLRRYAAIRHCIRGELDAPLSAGFADRVRAAVEREPSLLVPAAGPAPASAGPERAAGGARHALAAAWLKPAAGFAVAASVALVSLVGLRSLQAPPEAPVVERLAAASTPAAGNRPGAVDGLLTASTAAPRALAGSSWPATRWDVEQRDLRQRLNAYLLDHTEFARIGEMQGMLSYSRLVGYDRSR